MIRGSIEAMQEHTPRPIRHQRMRRISVFDGQDFKKALLAGAAHDALLGARGNSGVILSQTLRGLAAGLKDKQTFTTHDLAAAFELASQLAYRAVLKPVEGTILTVVRETAEAATHSAQRDDDLIAQMQEIVNAAHQAVAHTPELLPTLKQAGVVDAGGQGFCTILEGILRYMRGETTEATSPLSGNNIEHLEAHTKKGRVKVEEEFGYEVVFLLRGTQLDVENIRQTIIDMGGVSTVVAGDETMLKVHTHTLTPGKILDYGVGLGSLLDINIENLQEQSLTYAAESAAEHADDTSTGLLSPAGSEPETEKAFATVAVVAGPGFEQVFRGLGASAIVSGGQTMNPSIEELLDAVEKTPARQIIILPNNSNVILSAQQVADLTQKEVYVIPCKTLPQGIAALVSFNHEADFASNCATMSEAADAIQTAEITTAVRSVQLGGLHVREGDYIGVINGNLAVASQNMLDVIQDTLRRMNIDSFEIVTLYYGADITAAQAQELASKLKGKYSHLEIEVINGGQPYYTYIISAE
jgi:DAK2 domain fusion protein YloV